MLKNIFQFFFPILIFPIQLNFAQTASLEPTLELREVGGETIPYQNNFPLPSFEKQNREIINLKGEWKKQRFTAEDNISLSARDESGINNLIAEAEGRHLPGFDDSAWETKILPAVENEMNPAPTPPEMYDDGIWYRKKFTSAELEGGKFIKLIFYSVNYIADVWLNGEYLGWHEGGYTPFAFDVSEIVIPGEENVLAVRVDNIKWGTRNDIVPFTHSDWFKYSGIIHDVYLEVSNQVSIMRANIVPLDLEGSAEASILIYNGGTENSDVTAELNIYSAKIDSSNIRTEFAGDLTGEEINFTGGGENTFAINGKEAKVWKADLQIPNPEIWTPKEPNLYILKVTLKENENIIDEFYTQFGIRNVSTDGNKFLLNDKVVFLTGSARHEDHPIYGRSMPSDVIFDDLQIVKNYNINFLRTAHYPNHPFTYLAADRLGLTIMEEIPVWWFDSAEPWIIQNEDRKIHLQMFREMVFRDFNRPSIIMWSLSNECKEETNRLIYNEMITNDIKNNYYDGRLISQSSAGDNPGPSDITQAPLDAAGWTLYFGVFHGSTYFAGTANFLTQAKNAFPDKPVIDTEFGYWSSEDGSSTDRQVEVFEETFKAFKFFAQINEDGTINENGILFCPTWWCIFDWYQYKTNGYQTMGLLSMDRVTEKPVAAVLKKTYEPYFNFEGVVTGVKDEVGALPRKYLLEQNYPNPFNPKTKIKFAVPSEVKGQTSKVSLRIFDILGNEIKTLVDEEKSPGNYEVEFESANYSSGVYIYQLKSGSFSDSKKMLMIK